MKISVLAGAAALTALLLAGCGGDNKSVATATTAAASVSATTDAGSSATTSGGGASATTQPSGNDAGTTTPSFEGDTNSEFCKAARELEASNIGATLSGDSGDMKGDLEKVQSALNGLKDKAPAEIKDDINTFATSIQKIKDFYAKYDYDQAKLLAAAQKDPTVMQEFASGLSSDEFTAAATRISAYTSQVCGIADTTETT